MVKNHRKWSLIVCKTMIMKVNKSQIQQWWWQWKASVCFYFFPSRCQTIQCQVVGSMASSLESLLPLILQDFEVRVCRIRWTWQNKWWQPFLQKWFLSIMKRAFCSAGGEWWEMRSVQRQGYEQAQVIAPLCDTDLSRVAKRKLIADLQIALGGKHWFKYFQTNGPYRAQSRNLGGSGPPI